MLSIVDGVATYRVLPVTNEPGRSFMEGSRQLRVTDDSEPGFLTSLEALFDQEIDNVMAHFADGGGRP